MGNKMTNKMNTKMYSIMNFDKQEIKFRKMIRKIAILSHAGDIGRQQMQARPRDGLEGRRTNHIGPLRQFLTMPALLVRAHETDTNAWYPVATSQPLASTVHGRRRGINAHHRRRREEELQGSKQRWNTKLRGTNGIQQAGQKIVGDVMRQNKRQRRSMLSRGETSTGNKNLGRIREAIEPASRLPQEADFFCVTGENLSVTVPKFLRLAEARFGPSSVLRIT
jgi:hypothetical protein